MNDFQKEIESAAKERAYIEAEKTHNHRNFNINLYSKKMSKTKRFLNWYIERFGNIPAGEKDMEHGVNERASEQALEIHKAITDITKASKSPISIMDSPKVIDGTIHLGSIIIKIEDHSRPQKFDTTFDDDGKSN